MQALKISISSNSLKAMYRVVAIRSLMILRLNGRKQRALSLSKQDIFRLGRQWTRWMHVMLCSDTVIDNH